MFPSGDSNSWEAQVFKTLQIRCQNQDDHCSAVNRVFWHVHLQIPLCSRMASYRYIMTRSEIQEQKNYRVQIRGGRSSQSHCCRSLCTQVPSWSTFQHTPLWRLDTPNCSLAHRHKQTEPRHMKVSLSSHGERSNPQMLSYLTNLLMVLAIL